MPSNIRKLIALLAAGLALTPAAHAQSATESAYADFNDASGAISLIESGLRDTYEGRTHGDWVRLQKQAREDVQSSLKALAGRDLSPADRRVVDIMRKSVADAKESDSLAPGGRCEDAQRKDIGYAVLRAALYACFSTLSNSLDFEGRKVTRVGAFDLRLLAHHQIHVLLHGFSLDHDHHRARNRHVAFQ